MLIGLATATERSCGAKAGGLGALVRAGLPVPDGFVVPLDAYRAVARPLDPARLAVEEGPAAVRLALAAAPLPAALRGQLQAALDALGRPAVAVRSSATTEDTAGASAAGQHGTVLGVEGLDAVTDAVRACWASAWSDRAGSYREATGGGEPEMAVLVQRLVDAEVSGVLFTAGAVASEPGTTVIEATWGLGAGLVAGRVDADVYRISADGAISRALADKASRLDRRHGRVAIGPVPDDDRLRPALDDGAVGRLVELGVAVAGLRGGPQDIEWAVAGGRLWILQARPVTTLLPPSAVDERQGRDGQRDEGLAGTPCSAGTATGPARIVTGPDDFDRVEPGDILVCRFTDPAWTPVLRLAAGVVTEVGGVLSHAAIVARELGVPAVLAVPAALDRLADGAPVTIDGSAGTVVPVGPAPPGDRLS